MTLLGQGVVSKGECLYCRPSDMATDAGTVALASGTADASFPLTNLYDRLAHTVFKATSGACTVRVTYGGARAIQALTIHHHRLAGATVSIQNNNGLNQSVAVAANPADGLSLGVFKDLRLVTTSATQWDLVITGVPAGVVAMGEFVLWDTVRVLPLRFGLEEAEMHQLIRHVTSYGVRNKYSMGVRQRGLRGEVKLPDVYDDLKALERDAFGGFENFPLVPDEDINDALLVDLDYDQLRAQLADPYAWDVPVVFAEQQNGLAL